MQASRASTSSIPWPAAGKITSRTTPLGHPTAASATRNRMPDPAGIGRELRKGGALAIVGEQCLQTLPRTGIEAVGHALQDRVGVAGAQDAVETPCARSRDPLAGEPTAALALQHRRRQFARQQFVPEPT